MNESTTVADPATTQLRTTSEADPTSLWRDANAWNAIASGVPFRRTEWLDPWWQTHRQGRDANVIAVWRGGRLIGALPLARPVGTRTWRTMADGRTCTDHVSVLCRSADREAVAAAVAAHLVAASRDAHWGWNRLRLDGVVSGDIAIGHMLEKLGDAGCGFQLSSSMNTWVNVCDTDWEAFLKNRSKRVRYVFRSSLRTPEKYPGLTYHVASDTEEVQHWADQIIDLHQARWRQSGEPGSFGEPAARAMIDAAILAMHAAGRLYLPTLRLDGQLVAGGIYLIGDAEVVGHTGRLYCYSTGVDHDCEFSAGTTLNAFVMHAAHQMGCPAVDLLRGDEVYKDRLQCHPAPMLDINVGAAHLAGRWSLATDRCQTFVKQTARQLLKRPKVNLLTADEAFGPEHRWLLPGEPAAAVDQPAPSNDGTSTSYSNSTDSDHCSVNATGWESEAGRSMTAAS